MTLDRPGQHLNGNAQPSRLERLLAYLERDPANMRLLDDAVLAAFNEQNFEVAAALIERRGGEPLPPALNNLKGLIALARQDYVQAAEIFEALRSEDPADPALKFNLAWARAMAGDFEGSLGLLDDETIAVSPRAPSLKIHALHHLSRYDEALACGEALARRFPDDQALLGALATLALDAEEPELALSYGKRAGGNAEGLAALGVLTLGAHDASGSLKLFEEAIAGQPESPRAWVGKGLSLLATGDAAGGADAIDRGAALFNDHLGSWIASGWAHFIKGDRAKARASFERALAIDPNFSESHGGLAVLDVLEGDTKEAQRECQIALRLDKRSLGGALAASLLMEKGGRTEAAQKIRKAAFTMPIGADGRTLGDALIGFGKIRRS